MSYQHHSRAELIGEIEIARKNASDANEIIRHTSAELGGVRRALLAVEKERDELKFSPGATKVGAMAIIVDGTGRVLLGKKKRAVSPEFVGKWVAPGGRVNYGETLVAAVIRECLEETGVTVGIVRPLPPQEVVDARFHFVFPSFLCFAIAGEPIAGDDLCEVRWFERDELTEDFPLTPITRQAIRDAWASQTLAKVTLERDHAHRSIEARASESYRLIHEAVAEVAKLQQLVYMPGDWVCDTCGFTQHSRTLHASTGDVSAPRFEEVQICPNKDGQPMRRVTWKEGSESNYEAGERFLKENATLKRYLGAYQASDRLTTEPELRATLTAWQIALINLMPFALEDYYANFATPEYRAAMEACQALVIPAILE